MSRWEEIILEGVWKWYGWEKEYLVGLRNKDEEGHQGIVLRVLVKYLDLMQLWKVKGTPSFFPFD